MDAHLARQIARSFDLRALPAEFLANPYPVYAALRENDPVRLMPDGSYLLTRHADLMAVYRDAATFSSDKKAEFTPKYGADSALLAHHTSSLVFNDPPLNIERANNKHQSFGFGIHKLTPLHSPSQLQKAAKVQCAAQPSQYKSSAQNRKVLFDRKKAPKRIH